MKFLLGKSVETTLSSFQAGNLSTSVNHLKSTETPFIMQYHLSFLFLSLLSSFTLYFSVISLCLIVSVSLSLSFIFTHSIVLFPHPFPRSLTPVKGTERESRQTDKEYDLIKQICGESESLTMKIAHK